MSIAKELIKKHKQIEVQIKSLTKKRLNDRTSESWKNLKDLKKKKTDLSEIVAIKLAEQAKEKKITKVYFDRGLYKYHGRVKIFAETLRKNGMEF